MNESISSPRVLQSRASSNGCGERERKRNLNYEQRIKMALVIFACGFQGICSLAVLMLFCLQGFHALGFQLDNGLMHWMGVLGVGNVCSLSVIVYKAYFGRGMGK